MGREVFSRLTERLEGRDAQLRLELVISHLFVMSMARYVVKIEPLATSNVDAVGSVIQRYFTDLESATR
jgi:hypothetical protein